MNLIVGTDCKSALSAYVYFFNDVGKIEEKVFYKNGNIAKY